MLQKALCFKYFTYFTSRKFSIKLALLTTEHRNDLQKSRKAPAKPSKMSKAQTSICSVNP